MSDTPAPWWEVVALRDEVTSSGGAIDDVQMSLHNAVFGQEGVGAGRTPYSDAAYFGSITHPTGNLVELMARVAVRLGVPGSTQTERDVAPRPSDGRRQVPRADRAVAPRGASPGARS